MNKIIKEQLNKCKYADIPQFDETTTTLHIPCGIKQICVEDIQIGKQYAIELEDYIVHPYPGFSLHDNWNGGKIPREKIMSC